jgi:hypothetical protein
MTDEERANDYFRIIARFYLLHTVDRTLAIHSLAVDEGQTVPICSGQSAGVLDLHDPLRLTRRRKELELDR